MASMAKREKHQRMAEIKESIVKRKLAAKGENNHRK